MRIDRIADPAQVPVTTRRAADVGLLDIATRIVVAALGCATIFLIARIAGLF